MSRKPKTNTAPEQGAVSEDKISSEDLDAIAQAKIRVQLAVSHAEKTAAEARVMDLEYKTLVQHIFIKYGLKVTDKIDDGSGIITRSTDEEEGK